MSVVDQFISVQTQHAAQELIGSLVVVYSQGVAALDDGLTVQGVNGSLGSGGISEVDIGRAGQRVNVLKLDVGPRLLQLYLQYCAELLEEVKDILFFKSVGQLLDEQISVVDLLPGLGAFPLFLGHLDVLVVELADRQSVGVLVHAVLVPRLDARLGG